jgi:hypothetical protein
MCIYLQSSIRMALRRKFKCSRQPLCSSDAVADFRQKFGRPGVSGRKRKHGDGDMEMEAELVKTIRGKVLLPVLFNYCINICIVFWTTAGSV